MSRFWLMPLAATLLGACKVQPTPREYIDRRNPPAVERQAAAEELQDRLLAMGQALNRGDADEAMIALAPGADAYVLTPAGGGIVVGAEQVGQTFRDLAAGGAGPVLVRDVEVVVGPREDVAWFRALLSLPGRAEFGGGVRMTGIYVREEGAWRLEQAHLSATIPPPDPETASPDGDAAPPEAG